MNSQQTKQRRQLKIGSWLERISDWCSGRRKAKWTRKDSRGRRDTKSCAWKLLKFPAGEREGTVGLGVHRWRLHLIQYGMFSLLPSKSRDTPAIWQLENYRTPPTHTIGSCTSSSNSRHTHTHTESHHCHHCSSLHTSGLRYLQWCYYTTASAPCPICLNKY